MFVGHFGSNLENFGKHKIKTSTVKVNPLWDKGPKSGGFEP